MGATSDSPSDFEGRKLGEFVLREQIGRGGQGVVYRAEQPVLGREAAVKIVSVRGKSEGAIFRFLREVKIAAQLDHPFAAHIYAFGAEPDVLWVAMEFVHGQGLDRMLAAEGPMPLRRFLPLFERLCDVVQSAHEQGIMHRDIKPANVMVLSRAGRLLPKLLDLGIAKAITLTESHTPTDYNQPVPARPDPSNLLSTTFQERTPLQGVSATTAAHKLSGGDRPEVNDETREVPFEDVRGASVEPNVVPSLLRPTDMVLTRAGAVVGSPPYMAPEAWLRPDAIDAHVDVYSLGILAFECLTGHRPFREHRMTELQKLHLHAEVPALGGDLPAALDAVMRHALAKRPQDRFHTPLEFVTALRDAVAQQDISVPRLDEVLRDDWLTHAPQPIADSLALLEAARSEEQARDALSRLERALLHYFATLALACYTQGPRTAAADRALAAGLASLSSGSRSSQDWIAIIVAACAPFAAQPSRAAVPELISFACDADGYDAHKLASITAIVQRTASGGETERLPAAIDDLTRLLQSLSFVGDYALGLRRGGETEALVGLRRNPRRSLSVHNVDDIIDDTILLFDRDERPCLCLSPFAKVCASAPGLEEELFLFDGIGTRGVKQIAFPGLFERQDEEARAWLEENLPLSLGAARESAQTSPPYLGLSTFRLEDASSYFGREREVEEFVNRLRVHTLLAVVGPSGVGKSSFIQAGVLPSFDKEVLTITIRPGRAPLATLLARFERVGLTAIDRDEVALRPALLGERARAFAQSSEQMLIVIVDQLEELFTLCLDEREREIYAAALVGLSDKPSTPVRVLFTLRDDFLVRAESLPALRARIGAGLQLLTTPQRSDLLRILTEPLRARRYTFEDEALAAQMVEAVQSQPGALALLSFTARQLWESRDQHFHRLTRRAYSALGGVGGALAQHAEATLTGLAPDEQARAREAFRHLVTSQGTRATLTRVELQQLLGNDAAASTMLEKLVHARLLVTQEGEGGVDRVEIIHEALLSAWPRLVAWQREDAEAARLRDSLRAAARQWEERGRSPGLLWRADALAEYRLWRARYQGGLTASEAAFADASIRDAQRGQRIRRTSLAAVVVGLALFSAFLIRANTSARHARAESDKARAASEFLLRDSYLDQGRQLLLRGDPLRALVYFDEAQKRGASGPIFDFLVTEASLPVAAQERLLQPASDSAILDVSVTADGRRVAAANTTGMVRVWNTSDGASTWSWHSDASWVSAALLTDGGSRLVTFSDRPILWDLATQAAVHTGPVIGYGGYHDVNLLAHELLQGSADGTALLWDWSTGRVVQRFENTGGAMVLGLSPDRRRVFTIRDGVGGWLWDVSTGRPIAALPNRVKTVAFSPSGDRIAALNGDGDLFLLDANARVLLKRRAHATAAAAIAFSPNGRKIATGGNDNIVALWAADTLENERRFEGHSAQIAGVVFLDDHQLYSYATDGNIRFWDLDGGVQLGMLATTPLFVVQLSADAEHLVTGGWDGSVSLWRWRDAVRTRRLPVNVSVHLRTDIDLQTHSHAQPPLPSNGDVSPDGRYLESYDDHRSLWITPLAAGAACRIGDGHERTITSAFTPDGEHVYVAFEGSAVVGKWRTRDCVLDGRLTGHRRDVRALRVSPEGRYVASGGLDTTARIWDARTGALVQTLAGTGAPVALVEFSRDSNTLFLAAASKDKVPPQARGISAWRIADGNRLWSAPVDEGNSSYQPIMEVLDAHRVLIASGNTPIELRDIGSGHVLHQKSVANLLRLQPSVDGRRIFAGVDGAAVLILNGETLETMGSLEGPTALSGTFSPDGSIVMVTGDDNVLRVFDVETHRLLATQAETAFVIPGRHEVVLLPANGAPRAWDDSARPERVRDLHRLVRCRVPYLFDSGQLNKAPLQGDCRP